MRGIERLAISGDVGEIEGYCIVRSSIGEDRSRIKVYVRNTLEKIGEMECKSKEEIYYQNNINNEYGVAIAACNEERDKSEKCWLLRSRMFWKKWEVDNIGVGTYTQVDNFERVSIAMPYNKDCGSKEQVVFEVERSGLGGACINKLVFNESGLDFNICKTYGLDVDSGMWYSWVSNDRGIYLIATTYKEGADPAVAYWAYKVARVFGKDGYVALRSPKIIAGVSELREAVKYSEKVDKDWYTKVELV
jgi:hypothetical protein